LWRHSRGLNGNSLPVDFTAYLNDTTRQPGEVLGTKSTRSQVGDGSMEKPIVFMDDTDDSSDEGFKEPWYVESR
jgi:hypothetical protein